MHACVDRLDRQITHATLRKLTDIKGISEQKAQKIKEIAYKLVPMGFLTVREMGEVEGCVCARARGWDASRCACGPVSLTHTHTYTTRPPLPQQAAQQLETRKDLIMLSTGATDLDKLLGGAPSRDLLPCSPGNLSFDMMTSTHARPMERQAGWRPAR